MQQGTRQEALRATQMAAPTQTVAAGWQRSSRQTQRQHVRPLKICDTLFTLSSTDCDMCLLHRAMTFRIQLRSPQRWRRCCCDRGRRLAAGSADQEAEDSAAPPAAGAGPGAGVPALPQHPRHAFFRLYFRLFLFSLSLYVYIHVPAILQDAGCTLFSDLAGILQSRAAST